MTHEEEPTSSSSDSPSRGRPDLRYIVGPVNNTSGSSVRTWYQASPLSGTLIRQPREVLTRIGESDMKALAERLLDVIEEAIEDSTKRGIDAGVILPLRASIQEDGSVLLEWRSKDFRLGFTIEPESDQSGWYLVSKEGLGDAGASGPMGTLESTESRDRVRRLVQYVIAGS